MSENRYDPREIEPRWQAVWADERTWEVANAGATAELTAPGASGGGDEGTASSYVLEMLPYPSGEPHIGHLKVYSVGDAIAHYHRRLGRRVLHPMGYDSFGLPAENHAIKTGVHPRVSTDASIASFQRQFRSWGISIDWSRELATHEPSYYRWTQWIFLQLFEAGLAYRKEAAVKWCPKDQTVLANEQVDADGRCERCGAVVEVRQLEQWFLRITDYAERLLNDLDGIDWPEHVKTMQRNWIGRSEGAEVTFRCEELQIDYPVFTTRPDTLFGATFFVMAPEHPDVLRLVQGTELQDEVQKYVSHAITESGEERGNAEKPKTGVPLGRTVTNPVNGEQIPMYVADYVLMEYGTGAIMAVPGHDERDYAFARAFALPIRRVIEGPPTPPPEGEGGDEQGLPYTGDGELTNCNPQFDGMGQPQGSERDRGVAGRRGQGPCVGQLPAARLAGVTPALLGHADPDRLLRALRGGGGARGSAAGGAARDRGLRAAGALAASERRGVGAHQLSRVRLRGAPGDGHDGHVRRLLVVLPALLRRRQRSPGMGSGRTAGVDARGSVHRRGRARDLAPDVRAVLHQGARRPRLPGRAGAVPGAVHPGDGHQGRRQDEQVPRQRRLAGVDRGALRSGYRPLLHPVHRPARPGRGLVGRGHGGRAPVPEPTVAVGGRGI